MKIAHIIAVYKNPDQVGLLIERLTHDDSDIYIHLDSKVNIRQFEDLCRLPNVRFISDRVICNWGGFSFVHAIVNSMREVIESGIDYDYINLLSGQDYPLKPIEYFHEFLMKNKGKSFVTYEEEGKSDWWVHARSRYELFHFTDYKFRGRYALQYLLNLIGPKRNFPLKCKMFGSAKSSWWTLHYDCAKYTMNFLEKNEKLMSFMRLTWGGDEFLFPTIIINSPFRDSVVNDNLRLIEWDNGKPNPKVYTVKDIVTLKCSSNFFARKFDTTIDSEVLKMLDENVNLIV